jgi:tRNA-specific 2-thiouridylase
VIVGPVRALFQDTLEVRDLNWLDEPLPSDRAVCVDVMLRSSMPPCPGLIRVQPGNRARVVLNVPQRAVTPGQVCAFYRGDRLSGGGWITRRQR